MRKTIITLAAAAIIGMSSAAMADSKSYCAAEWPGDFRMQAHCLEKQREGAAEARAFIDRHGIEDGMKISDSPYAQMWALCSGQWELPAHETWDWRMVSHCLKRQMEGYRRVNK